MPSRPPVGQAAAPAITRAAAEQVLARYIAANNTANQARSDAGLGVPVRLVSGSAR